MNAPKSSKHSVSFMFIFPIVLIAMYALGLAFHSVQLSNELQFVAWAAFRLAVGFILGTVLVFAFYTLIAHNSPEEIWDGLRRTEHPVTGYENISRAFIVGGLLAVGVQLAGWPIAASMSLYLNELLTKGALALLLATVLTMSCCFLLGIKSVDHFVAYINEPQNNQIVFVTMIVINLAVFAVMR